MKPLFLLSLFPFLIQAQEYNSTITLSPFVQTGVSVPSGEKGLLHQSRLYNFVNLYTRYPEIFEIYSQQPNWQPRASHAFGITFKAHHDKGSPMRQKEYASGGVFTLSIQRFDVGMTNFHAGELYTFASSIDLIDWRLNFNMGPTFGDVFRVSPHFGFSLPLSREMNAQLTATDNNGEVMHFTPDESILRKSDFNLMVGMAAGYFTDKFSFELRYDLNRILTDDDDAHIFFWLITAGRKNGYGTWLNTFSLRFSYHLFSWRKVNPLPKNAAH